MERRLEGVESGKKKGGKKIPVQGTALGRSGKGAGGCNLAHDRSNPWTHTTNTDLCFDGLSFYRALLRRGRLRDVCV